MQHSFKLNQVLFMKNPKEAAELPFFTFFAASATGLLYCSSMSVLSIHGNLRQVTCSSFLDPGHVLRSETDVTEQLCPCKLKILGSGFIPTRLGNFRCRRWGSSLPGLRTLDPPLIPPSTPAEIFWRICLVPQIFVHPKSYFFCDLKPYAKFHNPTITPSGRKVTRQRERKKRRKREKRR
jgi:hypothetical protein